MENSKIDNKVLDFKIKLHKGNARRLKRMSNGVSKKVETTNKDIRSFNKYLSNNLDYKNRGKFKKEIKSTRINVKNPYALDDTHRRARAKEAFKYTKNTELVKLSNEARLLGLVRGYLSGKSYREIENNSKTMESLKTWVKCNTMVDMIKKYGDVQNDPIFKKYHNTNVSIQNLKREALIEDIFNWIH